ncbi:MAG: potassium-transporting ATPase subunit KdpC [Planctomycetaceae bacterium]|nr:potassium-transporting ATPase subunit KdpC [Planctomycetaceae bacterium]
MLKQLRAALVVLAALTVLTGVIYPGVVTAIAQLAFRHQANGSMIYVGGKAVGSDLIGQSFSKPEYFWGRLSATSPFPYNADASTGSNYGPLNPALKKAAESRIAELRQSGVRDARPPVDLVTASASGLDPHISVAAAKYQVTRVARARIMSEATVRRLVDQCAEGPQLGLFGEPRVNVLRLNLALNQLQAQTAK